jgi:hypothetical protein
VVVTPVPNATVAPKKPKKIDPLKELMEQGRKTLQLYGAVTSLGHSVKASIAGADPKWAWAQKDPDGVQFANQFAALDMAVNESKYVNQVIRAVRCRLDSAVGRHSYVF